MIWDVSPDMDVLGAKVEFDGKFASTLNEAYNHFYQWTLDDKGDDKRYNDKLACAFIDFARDYGWDAFKKAFRSYYNNSYPYAGQKYEGSASGVKLHEFVDRLSYYSGVDVSAKYIANRWPEALTEGYVNEGYDYKVYAKPSSPSVSGPVGNGNVTGARVAVYPNASTKGKAIGYVSNSDALTVLETVGNYAKVQSSNIVGYVPLSKLSMNYSAPAVGTVSKKATAYLQPKANKKLKAADLPKGTQVTITGRLGSWLIIDVDGTAAYTPAKNVKT